MATPKFNSKSPTIKRILREAAELTQTPSPDYHASPASDSDLFDWHFTLRGPPGGPYAEGIYHGRIVLPPTYPLRPPSFRFLTPSGRFEVNREICLSISGHHEETWQPAWGLRTALVALRAFMETDAKGQLGGLECGASERERRAKESIGWRCGTCARSNGDILAECTQAAEGVEGKVEEVEIPKELKLGFKDKMSKGDDKETGGDAEAELAEGFVRTGDISNDSRLSDTSKPANTYPIAKPAQSVPLPTENTRQTQAAPPAPTNMAQLRNAAPFGGHVTERRSNEGVPLWIDRAIAGIVLCLVIMIFRVLLGS